MMRNCKRQIVLILLLCVPFLAFARMERADSIVARMHRAAERHINSVEEYRADVYVKAQLDIIKKNSGFRFIPGLFKVPKDVNRFIVETFSELHFSAPDVYDRKIRAYTGTLGQIRGVPGINAYLNADIYKPYIVEGKLLSPLAPDSRKHYRYVVDSVSCDEAGRLQYHVRFIPRNKSYQLVEGDMTVTEGAWSVREMSFTGRSELLSFECAIKMGEVGAPDEYLPVENKVYATFSFAFNKLEGYYESYVKYHEVKEREEEGPVRKEYTSLDLTSTRLLQLDTTAYTTDFTSFDSLRPVALSASETAIYERYNRRLAADSARNELVVKPQHNTWQEMADFVFTDNRWNLNKNVSLRNSAVINPLLFSYSKSSGASYRQDLIVNTTLPNAQSVGVNGQIGYNFKYKEFYWSAGAEYQYWPEHLGKFQFEIGNGNRITNSDVIDAIKEIPTDSTINFDELNLETFTDLYFTLNNEFEITNGLTLGVGVVYHHRTPAERSDDSFRQITLPEDITSGLQENLRPHYNSFAPRVRLQWTPEQYYYMDGRQKNNLYSRYPTFILEYERGIKDIFNSTGKYERIEFDLQHHLRMGLLSNLYYRFGFGTFTLRSETYFADFENFKKSNIPEGWNDEIGGVFQALSSEWYNASPYYVRGHLCYESPFLLLLHFIKYTNHVRHERLYLNALTMKRLGPYFEFGYGIGTFVFDMGLFLSLEDFDSVGFGYKFTFELFSDK